MLPIDYTKAQRRDSANPLYFRWKTREPRNNFNAHTFITCTPFHKYSPHSHDILTQALEVHFSAAGPKFALIHFTLFKWRIVHLIFHRKFALIAHCSCIQVRIDPKCHCRTFNGPIYVREPNHFSFDWLINGANGKLFSFRLLSQRRPQLSFALKCLRIHASTHTAKLIRVQHCRKRLKKEGEGRSEETIANSSVVFLSLSLQVRCVPNEASNNNAATSNLGEMEYECFYSKSMRMDS